MRFIKRSFLFLLILLLLIAGVVVVYLLTGGVDDRRDGLEYRMDVESSQPGSTIADFQRGGNVAVGVSDFSRELRSVSPSDLEALGKVNGIYDGSPATKERWEWYQQPENFYGTLASQKIWKDGFRPETHERRADGDPINWTYQNIPLPVPKPCDQPQTTGYDAEGCRIVNALFKEEETEDPAKAAALRESVRRGRDVWFKGTFGMQDEEELHLSRTLGSADADGRTNWNYDEWLDTRQRPHRFSKWGLINDPDCVQGDETTGWMDKCQDGNSTGVLGYRKYPRSALRDQDGNILPPKALESDDEQLNLNEKWQFAQACVQCHVAFDPTNPPLNPNEPQWENLTGHIGNQYTRQPMTYLMGTPHNHFARKVVMAGREGTIDTSLVANDFMHNPGTQNNITDFMNKRVFDHEMVHPITGEKKTAPTFHVLKGGEDNVGDWLALIRVYVNIGLCTEECWVPKFPVPGSFVGQTTQQPFDIKQCSADCMPWNDADAKMPDLAAYLMAGGPYNLVKANDVDGTAGTTLIDESKIPQGRKVFIRECARCHSTKVPNDSIMNDTAALEQFYYGHVFGAEDTWQLEFDDATLNSDAMQDWLVAVASVPAAQSSSTTTTATVTVTNAEATTASIEGETAVALDVVASAPPDVAATQAARAADAAALTSAQLAVNTVMANMRPRQFAEAEAQFGHAMFGQDWLGNDELTEYDDVGTNRCRAMHDNHNRGHIWDQFSSETFKNYPPAGTEPRVINRLAPVVGGVESGKKDIGGGGPGYYRNISLLSVWSHAPFLHNNALGNLTYLDDGTYDYTVKGRVDQFEAAMKMLLTPSAERPQKITLVDEDITLATREDGKGPFYLTVPEGTPINAVASQNPHNPLFMKCSDLVENKGHEFGVDLSAEDKSALTEFLKLM